MTPLEFSKLLERFKNGEATPDEIRQIEQWYAYLGKHPYSPNESDTARLKKRSLERILSKKKIQTSQTKQNSGRQIFLFRSVAACLILVLSFLFFKKNQEIPSFKESTLPLASREKKDYNQLFENNSQNNQLVILEDGSGVLLSPGSKLMCKEGFGKEHRKTALVGNAYFEVTPDPNLPFFVLCEEVITKVIGTSFHIKSSSKSVEVEVHTGKVSVFKKDTADKKKQQDPDDTITLLANQKISFSSKFLDAKINLKQPEPEPIPSRTPSSHFTFSNTSLKKVFDALSSEYNLLISIDIPESEKYSFTGDLNNLTLAEKLEIICFSTGTEFHIDDTQILISGDGCE